MLLVIDIGNTNMEFGIFDGEKLIGSFRLKTKHDTTSDEIGLMACQFFSVHGFNREDIEDVVIGSVVPQIVHSVSNAVIKYFSRYPLIVGDNLAVPMDNLYDNPKEVGVDRLIAAIAAYQKYGGPLIVVDFGTATTFDAINAQGQYLGGIIYPGIKISMEALFSNTAKLPRVQLVKPRKVIGTNTVESIQSGAVYGYAGAVMNIVNMITEELGGKPKVIATGGLAKLINLHGMFENIESALTMQGLRIIYDHHQKTQIDRA